MIHRHELQQHETHCALNDQSVGDQRIVPREPDRSQLVMHLRSVEKCDQRIHSEPTHYRCGFHSPPVFHAAPSTDLTSATAMPRPDHTIGNTFPTCRLNAAAPESVDRGSRTTAMNSMSAGFRLRPMYPRYRRGLTHALAYLQSTF